MYLDQGHGGPGVGNVATGSFYDGNSVNGVCNANPSIYEDLDPVTPYGDPADASVDCSTLRGSVGGTCLPHTKQWRVRDGRRWRWHLQLHHSHNGNELSIIGTSAILPSPNRICRDADNRDCANHIHLHAKLSLYPSDRDNPTASEAEAHRCLILVDRFRGTVWSPGQY